MWITTYCSMPHPMSSHVNPLDSLSPNKSGKPTDAPFSLWLFFLSAGMFSTCAMTPQTRLAYIVSFIITFFMVSLYSISQHWYLYIYIPYIILTLELLWTWNTRYFNVNFWSVFASYNIHILKLIFYKLNPLEKDYTINKKTYSWSHAWFRQIFF